MNIYKVYDKNHEIVAIEDSLSVVRNMANLSAEETSKLFRRGRVVTAHFSIIKY